MRFKLCHVANAPPAQGPPDVKGSGAARRVYQVKNSPGKLEDSVPLTLGGIQKGASAPHNELHDLGSSLKTRNLKESAKKQQNMLTNAIRCK